MTSESLYEEYDEEGQPTAGQENEGHQTITVPLEELSMEVEPGAKLEVVSVEDGIATFKVLPGGEMPEEGEAKAAV